MHDIREDFYPDEAYLIVTCSSCGEPVARDEAFKDGRRFYHPDCAGVSRCSECGTWLEKGRTCCNQAAIPQERRRRDAVAVLAGLALILAFALGLVLGAKVEQGVRRPVVAEVRR
jgi:hypothetical protein